MINVLIADDEPLARERLLRLLKQLNSYNILAKEAKNGQEAIELAKQYAPEIVLLDINMPGLSGLETAAQLKQLNPTPAVIFCTAHDEYALQAFDACAEGYLVKPIRLEQLNKALDNAAKLTQLQLNKLNKAQAEHGRTHISARTHKGNELVPIKSVICFIADNKYVSVIHKQGEVLIEDSLKSLEEQLGDQFLRIHRNALINLDAAQRLERTSSNALQIHLKGLDHPLNVSRRHASAVRKAIEEHGS